MRNGGELSDLEYLPVKTEYTKYLQIADTPPLVSLGPLNSIILDLNKPLIMRNGGELSDLEYLPMNTENMEYLHIADARTSPFLRPFKQNHSRFK